MCSQCSQRGSFSLKTLVCLCSNNPRVLNLSVVDLLRVYIEPKPDPEVIECRFLLGRSQYVIGQELPVAVYKNSNVSASLDESNFGINSQDLGLCYEGEAQCPRCTVTCQVKSSNTFCQCELCEHQFCIICEQEYELGHRFNPFAACGKRYATKPRALCAAVTLYLWCDIFIYPHFVFLTPIVKRMKCTRGFCGNIWALTLIIVLILMFIFGLITSSLGIFMSPILGCQRYKILTRKSQ
ncbi:unnamed protein product [Moneuplotes crassus]|uniref:IBR domain-containing protein n=1 Tax=Euplotes crassus TaxID=5936 RepID=A0AAD2CZD5_EUPCR|nr:unnamed protein product [Moneuplotes crassus]